VSQHASSFLRAQSGDRRPTGFGNGRAVGGGARWNLPSPESAANGGDVTCSDRRNAPRLQRRRRHQPWSSTCCRGDRHPAAERVLWYLNATAAITHAGTTRSPRRGNQPRPRPSYLAGRIEPIREHPGAIVVEARSRRTGIRFERLVGATSFTNAGPTNPCQTGNPPAAAPSLSTGRERPGIANTRQIAIYRRVRRPSAIRNFSGDGHDDHQLARSQAQASIHRGRRSSARGHQHRQVTVTADNGHRPKSRHQ